MKNFVLIGTLFFLGAMIAPALRGQSKTTYKLVEPDMALNQAFDDYHEQYLILFPLEATAFGDNRYNNLMPVDISIDFLAKEKNFYEQTLKRLAGIEIVKASPTHQLAAEVLTYELTLRLEGMKFGNERIPCHQFDGLPISFGQMGSGAGSHPFKSIKDYDDWLARIDAFVVWVSVAIEQFQKGMEDGYVLPRCLVEKMVSQCLDKSIVCEKPQDSIFYQPITKMPASFSDSEKARLRESYERAILQKLMPTYRRLGIFLRDEYLGKTRSTSGIGALPNGKSQYEYWVRYWTTTTLSPDEIFAIGEKEVARIRQEMEVVRDQMGFRKSLAEFFEHLRSDPQFMVFKTPEEVLAAFASIQGKIEPRLDGMFKARPKTAFEIRRTEAFREATASAEYMPGTADGSRPGIFYTPIPDASKFNITSGMESLFLHEAIPGHHYQVSLQQENEQLPKFARFLWYGAYGEGWALYCESLGKELGLYSDPRQYIGALNDEMHRAIRLVVDVGLHWKGWTREQALEYMMANESIAEDGAIAEIERYMAMPGQALAYKIGQLKIRELRDRYEKQLGNRFSLADFHQEILRDGGMPLSILQRRMDVWASRQSP